MISLLDLLYIIGIVCLLVVTGVIFAVGLHTIQVLQEIKQISRNVEHMSALVERVADATLPGIERLAKRADTVERSVSQFIAKKIDQLTKG